MNVLQLNLSSYKHRWFESISVGEHKWIHNTVCIKYILANQKKEMKHQNSVFFLYIVSGCVLFVPFWNKLSKTNKQKKKHRAKENGHKKRLKKFFSFGKRTKFNGWMRTEKRMKMRKQNSTKMCSAVYMGFLWHVEGHTFGTRSIGWCNPKNFFGFYPLFNLHQR